jgi:hypothetical protein
MRAWVLALALVASAAGAAEEEDARHCFGEPELLGRIEVSGATGWEAGWRLKAGTFYEVRFAAADSRDLRIEGDAFFASIVPAELALDGEILPLGPFGLPALDFAGARELRFGFIPTAPGAYRLAGGAGGISVVVE